MEADVAEEIANDLEVSSSQMFHMTAYNKKNMFCTVLSVTLSKLFQCHHFLKMVMQICED